MSATERDRALIIAALIHPVDDWCCDACLRVFIGDITSEQIDAIIARVDAAESAA